LYLEKEKDLMGVFLLENASEIFPAGQAGEELD
jgi:hypothetical protein